jgi:hypothetical protein
MELTEKNYKERLDYVIETNHEKGNEIDSRMREKGVECSLIMPLVEVILNFDAVKDIEYEESSDIVRQRFDFLLDKKLLIEAKRLSESVNDHLQQASDYIFKNDDIDYGILTNGWEYAVLLQRDYIQRIANEGKAIEQLKSKKVIHAFSINIDENISNDNEGTSEDFIKTIKMFSKENYETTFRQLAKFIMRCYQVTQGAAYTLHDNKKINLHLQQKVSNRHREQKGTFYRDIETGVFTEGEILFFEDDYISLEVKLDALGKVILEPDKLIAKNLNEIVDSQHYNILPKIIYEERWNKEKRVFEDYKDIFRKITGRKRISESQYSLRKQQI